LRLFANRQTALLAAIYDGHVAKNHLMAAGGPHPGVIPAFHHANPGAVARHQPGDSAGISVVKSWDHAGMRATGSHEVIFRHVRVAGATVPPGQRVAHRPARHPPRSLPPPARGEKSPHG
jgi:hypothetical protein